MVERAYDVVVIGSGPAGQKAAIQAAKLKHHVLVVERSFKLGGGCLHSGTIPSKALREAILDLGGFAQRSFYANEPVTVERAQVTLDALNARLARILDDECAIISRQFSKNAIDTIQAHAYFRSPNELRLLLLEEQTSSACAPKSLSDLEQKGNFLDIKAKKIIIATGSTPRNPVEVPFDQTHIFDSTRLLKMPTIPSRLIVLGAGIVGTEYASFFAFLGTRVTLVDKRAHLMEWLDQEISTHLGRALKQVGLHFIPCARPEKIWKETLEGEEYQACVKLDDGTILKGDALLYALGRGACTERLELERAGVKRQEQGFIEVSENYQTSAPSIYAVGDVIGPPALAATSMEQGRTAAIHACRTLYRAIMEEKKSFDSSLVQSEGREKMQEGKSYWQHRVEGDHLPLRQSYSPIGIYTIPEISSLGESEEQLLKKGIAYEVGRAYYYELARARICGERTGLFKILFCPQNLKILGLHIIGRSATEVIHIGQLALQLGATIDYFVDHTFNYPTYAEGYRIAALNGLNKIRRFR